MQKEKKNMKKKTIKICMNEFSKKKPMLFYLNNFLAQLSHCRWVGWQRGSQDGDSGVVGSWLATIRKCLR